MRFHLEQDRDVFELMQKELKRQQEGIELIASENFVSEAVLEAVGSVMTNKYAEGYPGKRYYGGCQFHDQIETIAIERAKQLFGAEHANVQPHSGAVANLGAYFAFAKPEDVVLAMSLDHGGHLTHGAKVNFSGKLFNIISYGVHQETGLIDYDEVERLAHEHRPKVIVAGASAYARVIDFKRFAEISQSVGAKLMVDMAHIAGLVATGLHPSPIPYADVVTSTTHKTLRGPRGGLIVCSKAHQKAIDSAMFPGVQGGPLMHVIAGKAVCFGEALRPEFKSYQEQVLKNAKVLAASLVDLGYDLVSGGTDNHLVLVDLRKKGVDGRAAEDALSQVDIIVNKNKIPFDPATAVAPSGMRLGTPAMTTRGMKEKDMRELAHLIDECLQYRDNISKLKVIRERVHQIAKQFSLYPNRSF